jgi:3'-5' exonuclease
MNKQKERLFVQHNTPIEKFQAFDKLIYIINTRFTTYLVTCMWKFQREDWRIRPLSVEMIEYARCDAHYLLYIANSLCSELHCKATSGKQVILL